VSAPRARAALALLGVVLATATPSVQLLKDPSTFSCQSWVTARQRGAGPFADVVTAWLQGYLAGASELAIAVAEHAPGVADQLRAGFAAPMLDADHMPAWLDAACRAHPDDTLGVVARRLLRAAYTL
jgi:hypothetical protein